MISRTKPKNSEETPVPPDASSATQNITADQAGTSSDHEAQHTAEPSSDNPGAITEFAAHVKVGPRTNCMPI